MAIRFYCDQCGQKIKAQDDMAGMRIACPTCRDPQTVPIPVAGSKPAITERADAQALKMAGHFDPMDFTSTVKGYQQQKKVLNADDKSLPVNQVKPVRTLRGSLYFVFVLGLIPLVMSMLSGNDESVIKQLERAIETELRGEKQKKARITLDLAKKGRLGLDDVLSYFPNKKLKSAWLPRDTDKHYYLAMVCTIGAVLVVAVCLPKGFTRVPIMAMIGGFTSIFGIGMLLILQYIAATGIGIFLAGPFAIIIYMIGIAYRSLMNPDLPFIQCLASYTFGVGLCEEIIKALPIFIIFMGRTRLRWHECCAMGLASGIGFGIAEGIHYSSTLYNGLCDQSMYLVRFISCVTLHAIWCAASALFLHRFQKLTHGSLTLLTAFYRLFILISIPMVLHGLYDTFLSKEMDSLALTVAVFSFGWLVIMVEVARENEGDMLIQVSNVRNESTPLHAQQEVIQPVEGSVHAASPSPL